MDQAIEPNQAFRNDVLHSFKDVFGYHLSNFWLMDEKHNLKDPVTLNVSPRAMKEYIEYHYKTAILRPQRTLPFFQKQLVLEIEDLVSKVEYENSYFYNDFMVRFGYYHEIAVCIKSGNKQLGSLAFLRFEDEEPFNLQDRMCLEIISRYLSHKLKNYLEFEKIPEYTLLTTREKELLRFVQKGYTNAEIANLLFISTNTVKKHLQSLYQKLDVPNRTSLSYKAHKLLK